MSAAAGHNRQRGVTLPELLIALLIFAMVATASVVALRLGVEARDQLGEADARIGELQIARIVIREDLAQLRLRRVRDEFGDVAGAPFRGGIEAVERNAAPGETRLAAFVRAGWANPQNDAPRSTLQYVEYLVRDGSLVRRIRPFLDDARGQARFDRVLIKNVGEARIRFLKGEARGELEWVEAWPLPGGGDTPPDALSLYYRSDRYGDIDQHFWIGGPAPAGAP